MRRYTHLVTPFRRSLVALSGALVVVAGCQLLAGIERVEKEPDGVGDARVDSASLMDAGRDPCEHAAAPEAPSADDNVGDEPPFYLAIRTIDWSSETRGFDLDGTCTCDSRPGTFREGRASCVGSADHCDAERGIDNQAAKLVASVVDAGNDPNRLANEAAAAGRRGLLFYVTGYNGKNNDRSVKVGAMLTYGIVDPRGCSGSVPGTEGRFTPGWCGADRWTFPAAFVKPTTKVPAIEGTAYVRDGTLVARFSADMPIFFGRLEMAISSAVLSGTIAKSSGGTWVLEGTLAGRVAAGQWLASVGRLPFALKTDAEVCSTPFFEGFRSNLCGARDIMVGPALDSTEAACDAISSALALRADQASVGEERTDPSPVTGCHPSRIDAGAYACP